MKLVLGTAQFGLQYGIANVSSQISMPEATRILAFARDNGVDMLDTAIAYGGSEARLGAAGVGGFHIITKLPTDMDDHVESWALENLKASLKRLRVDNVYGLLIHRSQQLLGPRGKMLADILLRLKAEGIVTKIGVSIYDPQELELVTRVCPIDLVQAPFNPLDRRLLTSGWLSQLHGNGIEVHARSVFLQGLLLMPRHKIPEKFSKWSALFDHWHAWLEQSHTNAVNACIAFVNHPMIDYAVIGVDNIAQFEEILLASDRLPSVQLTDFSCIDTNLINPSNWNFL